MKIQILYCKQALSKKYNVSCCSIRLIRNFQPVYIIYICCNIGKTLLETTSYWTYTFILDFPLTPAFLKIKSNINNINDINLSFNNIII